MRAARRGDGCSRCRPRRRGCCFGLGKTLRRPRPNVVVRGMMKLKRIVGPLALAALLLSGTGLAQKKAPTKATKPAKGAKGDLDAIPFVFTPAMAQRLRGNDPAQVRSTLDEIRLAGKPASAATPVIIKML